MRFVSDHFEKIMMLPTFAKVTLLAVCAVYVIGMLAPDFVRGLIGQHDILARSYYMATIVFLQAIVILIVFSTEIEAAARGSQVDHIVEYVQCYLDAGYVQSLAYVMAGGMIVTIVGAAWLIRVGVMYTERPNYVPAIACAALGAAIMAFGDPQHDRWIWFAGMESFVISFYIWTHPPKPGDSIKKVEVKH